MRFLFKFLSIIGLVFCALVFCMIYFVEFSVPEKITTVEDSSYKVPEIFGLSLFNISIKNDFDVSKKNNDSIQQEAKIELFNVIPVKSVQITNSKRKYVVPGGEIFGIKL